ncbi:MAG: iron-containing alcohol dehydrogenase family protein [Defluviitaleaceae bacterium]|nr:iron-containing alcohol dehydrogenase family protein [Defluviitaleaceae bacterium]
MKTWNYTQPVEIIFKLGITKEIDGFLKQRSLTHGILVCDDFFAKSNLAKEIMDSTQRLSALYSDIQPNPTVENVQNCANTIISAKAKFALVLGGGSAIDCAKLACAIALSSQQAAKILSGEAKLEGTALPLIVLPTTAGTGSEVTPVSVVNDTVTGKKTSVVDRCLFPSTAVIDPELTISMPLDVTAATGMDALAHALEGFWSKNHQPICDTLALEAARKVFAALPAVYKAGNDIKARTTMCEASLLAGMAFALPRTAGSHSCSYPLTTQYGMPHGEACAFTLAAFTRINADAEDGRLHDFANKFGFENAFAMADRIDEMKKEMGLKCTLAQAGILKEDIPMLAQLSQNPNLANNPVEMDLDKLMEMYEGLS